MCPVSIGRLDVAVRGARRDVVHVVAAVRANTAGLECVARRSRGSRRRRRRGRRTTPPRRGMRARRSAGNAGRARDRVVLVVRREPARGPAGTCMQSPRSRSPVAWPTRHHEKSSERTYDSRFGWLPGPLRQDLRDRGCWRTPARGTRRRAETPCVRRSATLERRALMCAQDDPARRGDTLGQLERPGVRRPEADLDTLARVRERGRVVVEEARHGCGKLASRRRARRRSSPSHSGRRAPTTPSARGRTAR